MSPRATDSVLAFHAGVAGLCTDRLREALNPVTQLYDRQLRDRRWDATHGTEALTSTAICLIGIHRSALEPSVFGLDPTRVLEALATETRRSAYLGGFGLVAWANAVWDGPSVDQLAERCGLSLALSMDQLDTLTTMELAWLVSGLVHEAARPRGSADERRLQLVLTALLARHVDRSRLFSHATESSKPADRIRRWVPNFADQIYSVQACALAGLSRGHEGALAAANACGTRLVELQGKLGQWWWHYDARDGQVAQGFPVYSVHQHAMAPMALMTLAAAGGHDARRAVELSHAWIHENELNTSLLDTQAGTLWRDIEIEEGKVSRLARHARSIAGLKPDDGGKNSPHLRVNYETRPYEWGWCLFAGALAGGAPRSGHLV